MRTAFTIGLLLLLTVAAAPVASAGPLSCAQPVHLVCDVVNPVHDGAVAAAGAVVSYSFCVLAAVLGTPIPGIPAAVLAC